MAARIKFCNESIPDKTVARLKAEFSGLEEHFIEAGLLEDGTGTSYYKVYKAIADNNSLGFTSSENFRLLDSLPHTTIQKCFFKLLSKEQMRQIQPRHLEASRKIYEGLRGNVSPAMVAKRYVDHLNPEYLDLDYFKQGSLMAFYRMSKPVRGLRLTMPEAGSKDQFEGYEVLTIEMDKEGVARVNGQPKTMDELTQMVDAFVKKDLHNTVVEIGVARATSYRKYTALLNAISAPISKMRQKLARQKFNLPFEQLTKDQQEVVRREVPRNVILNEPK